MKKWLTGFSPVERRILALSFVMMFFCLLYFLRDDSSERPPSTIQESVEENTKPPSLSEPKATEPLVFEYVWRLSDLYSVSDQRLVPRKDRPAAVPIEINLEFRAEGGGPFFINVSSNEDFTGDLERVESNEPKFKLLRAHLGNNYWRISQNGRTWSDAYTFTVQSKHLENVIEPSSREIFVPLKGRREAVIKWNTNSAAEAYIAEVSSTARFEPAKTEIKWLNEPILRQGVDGPGRIFVRVRYMNSRQELSDYSPVIQVVSR